MRKGLLFLLTGILNTTFGYSLGLLIYHLMSDLLSVFVIAVLTNIIAIFFSFLTYKTLVFKTKGNWVKECCKCYLTYGVSALLGSGLLALLVNFAGIPFWVAQGASLAVTTIISFLAHNNFTFSNDAPST